MIDARDVGLEGIDAAFRAGIARLFDVMHTARRSEAGDDPLNRFAKGYDALLSDYQAARAVIDSPAAG